MLSIFLAKALAQPLSSVCRSLATLWMMVQGRLSPSPHLRLPGLPHIHGEILGQLCHLSGASGSSCASLSQASQVARSSNKMAFVKCLSCSVPCMS